MAGIFGVFRFDGAPVDRALVTRMSLTLAHRGPDGEGLVFEATWALGCRMLRATPESICERQPVQRAPGTLLVFDGRLDNRDELIDQLRGHEDTSTAMPDADLAAGLYELSGPDFAQHLVGDFAVAVFDRRNRRVVLARDAIGIRPLYYRRTAAALSFASEIKALTLDPEVPTRPNDRLLAELLLRQLHRRDHDGSTLVEGICEVPPAHVAIFDAKTADVRRYWDFDGHGRANVRSFDDCADGFRYHFERAVRRRLRSAGPVAIAVSGGTDSSSIFSVAARAGGVRPIGLSYSMEDGGPADETQFIADLERACGLPIAPVDSPSPAEPLFRADELIRRVEAPMANTEWVRADRLVATAHQRGARTLLSGHWGDQLLLDQAYLVDFLHSGSCLAMVSHLREYRRWFPEASRMEFTGRLAGDLLEYDLPRWVRGAVRGARRAWHKPAPWDDWYSPWFRSQAGPDLFSRELRPTPASGRDVSVLARALYREVRSRYHVLCLDWQNKMAAPHAVERAFPFLDRDLVEFVMGVPGRMLARDGVPKAVLRAALKDTVPASILRRRAKGDFTAAVNAACIRESVAIADLLTRDPLVVQLGYADEGKLRKGLASAAGALKHSQSTVASWRVTALVAFELWLRQLVENQRSKREDIEWRNISPVSAP